MSLYDKASLIFSGAAGAGNKDVAYNIKPVEKLKVDEYIKNGGFDTDSDWTKSGSVTISGGKANFSASDTSYQAVFQDNIIEPGKTYKISVEADITKGSFVAGTNLDETSIFKGAEVRANGSGKYSTYYTALEGEHRVLFKRGDSPYDFTLDNISVREVEQKANDFSFSRASDLTATYEGPDGLIKKTRENLLTYSNDFDNAIWAGSSTWTSGQSGYDGSTDAWSFNKASASGSDYYNQFFHGLHTFSIYAKKQSSAGLAIYAFYDWNGSSFGGNTRVVYNLDTGTELSNQSDVISTTCEAIGSNWWRISMTVEQDDMRWYLYTTDGTQTLVDNVTVTLQDAQLEQGLVATPYIHRTDSYSKSTAGIQEDEPRYDYSLDNALPPVLMLEPERTNKFIHSEYLASSSIFKTNSSFTTNQGTSPEGLNNAAKMNEGTASGNLPHNFYYSGIQNSKTYTISFYAKKIDRDHVYVNIYSGVDSKFVFYDLSDGTVATSSLGDVTASISDAGSGWYRISYTRDTASTGSPNFRIGMSSANGTVDYQGNGSETLFYGVQWEEGSCVTSYIPTYGSAATRKGEAHNSLASFSCALDNPLSNKYTFILDLRVDNLERPTTSYDDIFTARDASGSEYAFRLEGNVDTSDDPDTYSLRVFAYSTKNSGAALSTPHDSGIQLGQRNKIAIVFDETVGIKVFLNGNSTPLEEVLIGDTFSTDSTKTLQSNSFYEVKTLDGGANPRSKTFLYGVQAYDEALSDAECVSLTTIS